MQKLLLTAFVVLAGFLIPHYAFAVTTLEAIFCTLGSLVGQLTPIIAALALLAFFWGLAMYLFSLSAGEGSTSHSTYGMPASGQSKRQGTTIMLYGVIVLFVMVSVWGIVAILQQTFELQGGGTIQPPRILEERIQPPTTPSCR